MAINAATVWEIRTTGAQDNGGGFYNHTPGTSVDYSQQDAPQLSLSDVTVNTTSISSATGGFTSAMVGNICRISGGGATAGWYEITAVADTNNATIDRTGGSGTNSIVKVGGAFTIGGTLDDDFLDVPVAGNTIHIKAGEYTLGESVYTANNGTFASPVRFLGYNTSRGDNPTGTNRPQIICGSSYTFVTNQYTVVQNIRFTGSAAGVAYPGANNYWFNCECLNTSGTAGRSSFISSNSNTQLVKCVGSSTNGTPFTLTGNNSIALFCRAYDSVTGFNAPFVIGCVADNCSTQGMMGQSTTFMFLNNTIYNCGTGIVCGGNYPTIINNIIYGCTTGISAGADSAWRTFVIKNNCLNNTTDLSNVTLDATNLTATNPLLNNPASDDFTLQSGSPCFDAGMQPDSMIGL